ncbi:MAG: delta-lactam-biosynthetic de-N-acetylase [Lachnospiraceae bacterium]|jgi:peptidoglycan-N-acetylmuramic acid deacetylase|nr:delta-lactam-biosynthetic de-N-acetylase [Lachnospiraceae bacterium]
MEHLRKVKGTSVVIVLALFVASFFLGRYAAQVAPVAGKAIQAGADGNWGLSFQEEGQPPVANATFEELAKYNAYYAEDTQEKTLYLTFDCGFENGNTPAILDALKKHGVKAAFFIVGNYLETSPDLVKRMLEEGHIVGNHSYHHPDMSKMGKEEFAKELGELESLYEQAVGKPMEKYYRPPQGKYSEGSLQLAKELGYQTVFWSLAYVDWNQDSQPSHEEAFDKLLKRVHPGAIVLLHNTSKTNGEIMDELLTEWEKMGYTFKDLSQLAKKAG